MKKLLFVIFLLCIASAYAITKQEIRAIIIEEAQGAGLSTRLAVAVAMAESNMDADAISYDYHSYGVMQVNSVYGDWFAQKYLHDDTVNLFDARSNAKIGCRYLADLIKQFGDVDLALAAYNWGPGNVKRIHGDKTKIPKMTIDYIQRIYKFMAGK